MNWKLTPAEPDDAMYEAATDVVVSTEDALACHRAMLSAAPDPLEDAELVERVAEEMLASAGDLSDFIDNMSDFPEKVFSELARTAIAAMKGE